MSNANERYVAMIRRTLRHWVDEVKGKKDDELSELLRENSNLQQTILEGLIIPELWYETVKTMLDVFPLIERLRLEFDWILIIEEALTTSPERSNLLYAGLLNRYGQINYRQLSSEGIRKAIELHNEALVIATTLQEHDLIGYTLAHLGEASFRSNDLEAAQRYGEDAIRVLELRDQQSIKSAHVYTLLGRIYLAKGEYLVAKDYYMIAANQFRIHGLSIELGRTLNNIGQANDALGSYDQAIASFSEALPLLKEGGNRLEFVVLKTNLAAAYYHKNKLSEALAICYEIDVDYLRETKQEYWLGIVAQSTGNIAMLLGKFEASRSQLDEAIKIWEKIGSKQMLANSIGTKGQLFALINNTVEAAEHLNKAIKLLTEIGDNEWARKLKSEFLEEYVKVTGQVWGPDPSSE